MVEFKSKKKKKRRQEEGLVILGTSSFLGRSKRTFSLQVEAVGRKFFLAMAQAVASVIATAGLYIYVYIMQIVGIRCSSRKL